MMNNKVLGTVSVASILDMLEAYKTIPANQQAQFPIQDYMHLKERPLSSRIPESILIELWRALETCHPCADIGLIIGQTISPKSKGVLASWVSQAATTGEAFEIFQNNIVLMNPSERWSFSVIDNMCTLTLHIESSIPYPRAAIERSMAGMVAWARMLSSQELSIQSASFTCQQPDYINHYHDLFGNNIHFDSTVNTLIFDADFLHSPIASSSAYLKQVMSAAAQNTIDALSKSQSMKKMVASIVVANIEKGQLVGIETVASQLHTSRQTLYRKLEKEKTSFKAIVDEIRKEQALACLHISPSPNITEISYNLGFKDTSSFYKAFRRWFDTTPKEFIIQNDKNL